MSASGAFQAKIYGYLRMYKHPSGAARQDIIEYDWVKLQTPTGEVSAKVLIKTSMKEAHIRVPHGC
jgi:anaerobic selenocysteine-containing dehydrogenase